MKRNQFLDNRWLIALSFVICQLSFSPVRAQTNFNEGKTFKEILQMATEQGKPVFIDRFTDWCGPCEQRARGAVPR